MIFDGHGDIWTHVAIERNKGNKNIIKDMHLERFKEGNMIGGIFVIWIDPPHYENPQCRTVEIIESMSTEIVENPDVLYIVHNSKDFNNALKNKKLAIVIGMEGLSGIGNRVELLNTLYRLGIRHASLTWNEENELATGIRGNPDRGLTKYGIEAIKLMEKLGIIVDVAHANDKSFWDIYDNTKKPFIDSHSNCKALCNVPRNLADEQLKAIAEKGGLVGLNGFNEFIHRQRDKQDIHNLVNHLDYMVELIGINHVGFGFDFFHYLESDTVDSFVDDVNTQTRGLEDISKSQRLIDILYKRGYTKEDIEKISYKNYYRIIKEILG